MESVVRTPMTQFVFSWNAIQMEALQNVRLRESSNLFEDTGSGRELNYLAKICRSCFSPLWKN
jgi:hypothetical protein